MTLSEDKPTDITDRAGDGLVSSNAPAASEPTPLHPFDESKFLSATGLRLASQLSPEAHTHRDPLLIQLETRVKNLEGILGGLGQSMRVAEVEILKTDTELPDPAYAQPGDAGMDVYAARNAEIRPGERVRIPTGLKIALQAGYECQVRPRSGLAAKQGVTVLNSPGTIDSGYRGPVDVTLVNHGQVTVYVKRGDRIAQLVFARVCTASPRFVSELPPSIRGEGGFGSTGD